MEKNNLKILLEELKNLESERHITEEKIKNNQDLLIKIQDSFEKDLNFLKELQDREVSLRLEIYQKQKENLHEILSLNSIKKVIGSIGFFNKIKEKTVDKAKELKNYIDGTHAQDEWVDEQYEEYKMLCLKKKEHIQSKEEFKKIVISLKTSNPKNPNIPELFRKLSHDFKDVKKNLSLEKKVDNLIDSSVQWIENINQEKINKKQIFQEWLDKNKSQLSKDNEQLFIHYQQYLKESFYETYPQLMYKKSFFNQLINKEKNK